MKKRLDLLMVERALAPSREKAKAYIMSGDVYVDGQKEDKAFPELTPSHRRKSKWHWLAYRK